MYIKQVTVVNLQLALYQYIFVIKTNLNKGILCLQMYPNG